MRGVLLAALLAAGAARAADPAQLEAATRDYFRSEYEAGRPFMALGFAAIGGGVALALQDEPRLFHATWPTLVVGLVEAGAGVTLTVRSDLQAEDALARLAQDPKQFQQDELARVARIERETEWLLWIEGILAVAGVSMAIAGEAADLEGLAGAGYALSVQSVAMFGLDFAVRDRAQSYGVALRGSF